MLQIRGRAWRARYLATKAGTQTPSRKPRKVRISGENKVSVDIVEHFASANQQDILEQFPPGLLGKKHKFPDSYYIADREVAGTIAKFVTTPVSSAKVVLESNPGAGLLTDHLVGSSAAKVHLFEDNGTFEDRLREKFSLNKERVTIHRGDLVNMWKIAFQDRQDNGNRVQEILYGVPIKSWSSKPMRLFAATGSLNFIKYLINSIARQTDLFAHGRFEMFLAMPPPLYIHLTCNSEAGYIIYRANTILFQIMFEYKFLRRLPKKAFLPWQHDTKIKKHQKLSKFYSIDSDSLYLVKVTPRAGIYDLCPSEHMQALLYFVKQNFVSRKSRVIQTLEKWAPGCGPRLIIGTGTPDPIKFLRSEATEALPQFSVPCTTMSNKHFYPNMNIFTEFGDLTPSQILTLFTQFRQWPEFKESPFLASLENNLLKMETSDQETIDRLDLHSEDYIAKSETRSDSTNS